MRVLIDGCHNTERYIDEIRGFVLEIFPEIDFDPHLSIKGREKLESIPKDTIMIIVASCGSGSTPISTNLIEKFEVRGGIVVNIEGTCAHPTREYHPELAKIWKSRIQTALRMVQHMEKVWKMKLNQK